MEVEGTVLAALSLLLLKRSILYTAPSSPPSAMSSQTFQLAALPAHCTLQQPPLLFIPIRTPSAGAGEAGGQGTEREGGGGDGGGVGCAMEGGWIRRVFVLSAAY